MIPILLTASLFMLAATAPPATNVAAAVAVARPASRVDAVTTPASDVTALLEAASAPVDCPNRRDARSRLFAEVVPKLRAEGYPPSGDDSAFMLSALAGFPCAAGPLRITRADILGDAATVDVAGSRGGCSALMRRDGDGWRFVMILGWTLAS